MFLLFFPNEHLNNAGNFVTCLLDHPRDNNPYSLFVKYQSKFIGLRVFTSLLIKLVCSPLRKRGLFRQRGDEAECRLHKFLDEVERLNCNKLSAF